MIRLRRPTLDESNRLFTAAVIGGGAVAGSIISVIFAGALFAGVARLYQGKITLPTDRSVRWIGAAFVFYFLAEALSTFVNYTAPKSLVEGVVENIPFLAFLMIYGRLSLTRREDVLSSIEAGVIVGSFGALVYALVETLLLDRARAEGMAGNSGPFALVCSVLYGFAVVTAIRRRDRTGALAALAALAAAAALLLSGMRGTWPILVIAPLIPLAMFRINLSRRGALKAIAALFVPVVLLVAVSYGTVETRILRLAEEYKYVDGGDYDNSMGQRVLVWRAALTLIAERPVFGHGPAEAHGLMSKRAAAGEELRFAYTHAHNQFLNAWMRSGLFGLAATLALLVLPPWIAFRRPRDELGRTGQGLLLVISSSYFLAGLSNVCLGHDIMDTLYIYGVIATSYVVFGSSSRISWETTAAPKLAASSTSP